MTNELTDGRTLRRDGWNSYLDFRIDNMEFILPRSLNYGICQVQTKHVSWPGFELTTSCTGDVRSNQLGQSNMPKQDRCGHMLSKPLLWAKLTLCTTQTRFFLLSFCCLFFVHEKANFGMTGSHFFVHVWREKSAPQLVMCQKWAAIPKDGIN